MTQPESLETQSSNPYLRALLTLSVMAMVAGAVFLVVTRLIAPAGLDVIASNAELPLLVSGGEFGWNALGSGFLAFCLWLAVQGFRRR
jgi:hypothetical protein